jgi:hypothetical protein
MTQVAGGTNVVKRTADNERLIATVPPTRIRIPVSKQGKMKLACQSLRNSKASGRTRYVSE